MAEPPLKLRNVDSPLRRSQPENKTPAGKADRRPEPDSVERATEAPPDVLPPDVPPLDEHPAFLSTRVPESLQRRPARMAERLRERAGVRSQKALATQDVVAVLLWAHCDPDNPEDVEALQRLLRTVPGPPARPGSGTARRRRLD